MHCCQKNNISLLLYGRAEQWAAAGAWEDKVHDYSFQTVSACLSVINCDSLGNFWRCTSGQAAPLGWNLYRQTPLLFSFAASHWKQTWKLIRVLISRGFNMKLRRAAPIIMTEKATRLGSFFPLFLFFQISCRHTRWYMRVGLFNVDLFNYKYRTKAILYQSIIEEWVCKPS